MLQCEVVGDSSLLLHAVRANDEATTLVFAVTLSGDPGSTVIATLPWP